MRLSRPTLLVIFFLVTAGTVEAGVFKSSSVTVQVKAKTVSCEPRIEWPAPSVNQKKYISPGDDYCATLSSAQPGDEIIFAQGTYTSPCRFSPNGEPARPIYIRSANSELSKRAKFSCSGCSGVSNFFEVGGSYLVIKDLYFVNNDADIMVRFLAAHHVMLENTQMENIDGQAITANSGNTDSLIIRENKIFNINYTATYFGCHDGSCKSTNLLIEGNYLDASAINNSSITGYAMEIKLNSYGTIRDNSFFNGQGPALMVYGNNDANAPANIIEGNYLERSRNDAALNIGGGPALVRNNVIVNQSGTALFAQNYGGRGLQRKISIVSNTIVSSSGTAIMVQGWSAGAGNVVSGNAIYSATPYSPSPIVATLADNVVCGASSGCFMGSAATSPYNLSPQAGGPLASVIPATGYPQYDFFGNSRAANQPGALITDSGTSGLSLTYLQARPPRLKRCF